MCSNVEDVSVSVLPLMFALPVLLCCVLKVCVCYTADLLTSSIFTVDYYKGVVKSAVEAGAHMIGIKVSSSCGDFVILGLRFSRAGSCIKECSIERFTIDMSWEFAQLPP